MRGNIQWSEDATGKTIAGARRVRRPGKADDFPRHDPELIARDEAIFLLHTAAEIEHSLMVQYLYAAMTLNLGTEQHPDPDTARWQRIILGIAKEEMGHFITVQNILRLIGGPLNFEREDTPFRSDYYPFRFSLRPLTIKAPDRGEWKNAGSLNRYIAAEMPPFDQIKDRRDRRDVAEVLGCPDEKSLPGRARHAQRDQPGRPALRAADRHFIGQASSSATKTSSRLRTSRVTWPMRRPGTAPASSSMSWCCPPAIGKRRVDALKSHRRTG